MRCIREIRGSNLDPETGSTELLVDFLILSG
jgi:hypothetical protein